MIHATMEYADGEREPLCQGDFDEDYDFLEDEQNEPMEPVDCDLCIMEMRSRGWSSSAP